MLRENLSIKKCTTVLSECVGVVSFCPSLVLRNFFFFFFAMLQNIQTESLLMKTFYYELFVFVTCSVGLSDLH